MEEMLDDNLQMEDDEELEEEADAEVDKVLYNLREGKLGQGGTVKEELPVSVLVQCMLRLGILIPGVSANTEPGRGRGDGEGDGTVSAAVERAVERMIPIVHRPLLSRSYVLYHISFMYAVVDLDIGLRRFLCERQV